MPAPPPGVPETAAAVEQPGARRRVLIRLRGSVALFTTQVLEQAQAAHDDARATLSAA
ncbi:hypothetical protein [Kitasatospora sp. NPDC057223]|uniref:hypothetical protein n=1 Tax=Kitasatospora sp. NPDC057223 TaxID=3346055 RepID=UPI0036377A24